MGLCLRDVRFTPESGHCRPLSPRLLCAKSGLSASQQNSVYSITSSAATRRLCGTVIPRAFAVLRLMTKRAIAAGKTLGRPLNDPDAIHKAKRALREGIGINRVAKLVGLSNGTVQRPQG
jgi:hypothetical protein